MLEYDERRRPSAKQVLEHPWVIDKGPTELDDLLGALDLYVEPWYVAELNEGLETLDIDKDDEPMDLDSLDE